MNAPCKGCTERRYPYCYDTCERYQAYRAKLDRAREERLKDLRVIGVLREGSERARKEGWRHGKLKGRCE